ncbi:hypothetical protein [Paenibacillus daejeonensis]|uniref:hypothetical protein n=1 Tax=Paenibacillus daejeonensis TaxID=135193 RepID=UPI0003A2B0C2|nr:hypothetical protein [Paenibacillus daejeonensis]
MMAVNIPILLIMASMHNDTLNKEIENVIRARNGEIIEVVKMNEDSERTPFKEQTGRSNIIFKVTYKVRDEVFVAWYRAVKTLNDIHDQKDEKRVRGYGEMWIFESDEMSEWSSEK